jgi:hypothetical protein
LVKTPSRCAKAMLFFTKGYEESVDDIVKNAVFNEDHDEMYLSLYSNVNLHVFTHVCVWLIGSLSRILKYSPCVNTTWFRSLERYFTYQSLILLLLQFSASSNRTCD